jgi:hypothetical protein
VRSTSNNNNEIALLYRVNPGSQHISLIGNITAYSYVYIDFMPNDTIKALDIVKSITIKELSMNLTGFNGTIDSNWYLTNSTINCTKICTYSVQDIIIGYYIYIGLLQYDDYEKKYTIKYNISMESSIPLRMQLSCISSAGICN